MRQWCAPCRAIGALGGGLCRGRRQLELLERAAQRGNGKRLRQHGVEAVFVSTVLPHGMDPLKRALQAHTRLRRPLAEIQISHADGKLLAEIHEHGEVIDQRTVGERLVLRARVGEKLAGRLRRAGAIVERDSTGS